MDLYATMPLVRLHAPELALSSLRMLTPELTLTGLALAILAADLSLKGAKGRLLYWIGMASALITVAIVGLAQAEPEIYMGIGTLWVVDPLAIFFKLLVLAATVLVLALAVDYRLHDERHLGSFTALVLLAAVGMMLLVSASDLLLVFLALELVSISSFVLVGFERRDLKASEGAMKYFLIGAFSSAIMVYGISLYYGATRTTALAGLDRTLLSGSSAMFVAACLFLLVGLGFKVSMAPFHLWVPDAYEGAPTPVTTYLSIAPKVAGLAVMARVFAHLIPHSGLDLTLLLSFLAMLTMSVGNLTALFQTNVKRLLAYSSIAQAGYLLIGLVAATPRGVEGLMLYALTYLFMNLGAFAVAIAVGNEGGYELDAYDGLATRNFGLALLMTFFLLSLAGIPPLAGFIGKFYLFAAAIESKLLALAVVAVLNSVVSVYYYMLIAQRMFFKEPRTLEPVDTGPMLHLGLTVAALGVFVVGLYPEPFVAMVRLSNDLLPAATKAVAALPR